MEQQRIADRAAEQRLDFYRRKIQPELSRFLSYLESIPDPALRYLAYALNASKVANYGNPMQMWGYEGIVAAGEACQQCVEQAVAPLLEGFAPGPDAGGNPLGTLPSERVKQLLRPITSSPTETFVYGHPESGFFWNRFVEDGSLQGWLLGTETQRIYENNQDNPIIGTITYDYVLTTDLKAFRMAKQEKPESLGYWYNVLGHVARLLGVPDFTSH